MSRYNLNPEFIGEDSPFFGTGEKFALNRWQIGLPKLGALSQASGLENFSSRQV